MVGNGPANVTMVGGETEEPTGLTEQIVKKGLLANRASQSTNRFLITLELSGHAWLRVVMPKDMQFWPYMARQIHGRKKV